jgi:lipocalin
LYVLVGQIRGRTYVLDSYCGVGVSFLTQVSVSLYIVRPLKRLHVVFSLYGSDTSCSIGTATTNNDDFLKHRARKRHRISSSAEEEQAVNMSRFTHRPLVLLLLWLGLSSLVLVSSQEFEPIDDLDVDAYMGRWYQMYTTKGFILLELGGRCTTADYELRDDGKVELINQSRPWLVPQQLARTYGFAVQSSTVAGAFSVTQQYLKEGDPDDAEFDSPGNYWIIGIGPIVDGEYQWAAVSDPDKTTAFVLARDPEDFKGSDYEEDALDVFEQFGFDSINKPLPTSHFACFDYPDK